MTFAVSKLVRGGLILVFGAYPASSLLPLALFGVIGGLGGFFGGDLIAGAYLLWAVAGVYGTISLWVLVFIKPGPVIVMGLLSGSVAMLFWLGLAVWDAEEAITVRELTELVYFNVAPMIVASITMGIFFYTKSRKHISID